MISKIYLGDGVYVAWYDHLHTLELSTEDGIRETNSITLESDVMDALVSYWMRGHPKDREREAEQG